MKKIDKLKRHELNCNVFSVYDYHGLSMQELLCEFFTKINECVEFSESTLKLADWLVNEGLSQEVVKKLMLWLEDGTLEGLINETLFKNLNDKINSIGEKVEIIFNEQVNIKQFGAKGDGINNDTESLKKAIDYLKSKGGRIYVPCGIYLISEKIYISNNITIVGECYNTILKANSNNFRLIVNGDNIEISTLTIDGNKDKYSVNKLIDCNYENGVYTNNFTLTNCKIGNMKSNWCHGVSLSNNKNSIIRNCIFENFECVANGIIGDLEGTSRAIVISNNTNDYIICDNIFKGLVNEEDSDFIHVLGEKSDTNDFPFIGGVFGQCKGDIKNNSFYGYMKSAIKVQSQGVNIIGNTIDIRGLKGLKAYSSIRVQNSIDCNVSNNVTLLNSNEKISSVYVLQRSKNVIYSNNNIIYSSYRANDLIESDRSMFTVHQCENCIIDGVNIVGKNHFNRFIWLMQPGNVIIKNVSYDNSNYPITNIFYFTEKDEKAKVTIENVNVDCGKSDKPFYSKDLYGGVIKLRNVSINILDSVTNGLFKQIELTNYENIEIDNVKIEKNFTLNLQGCKNINVENSVIKSIQLKNESGFDLKSSNNVFTSGDSNSTCYNMILDNNGTYNVLSINNVNENCKNMFSVQDDVNKFINKSNLKVKSIDDVYLDYAINNYSNFIVGLNGATPTYESYYIKTCYSLDKITCGWQNIRHNVILANGTIFYQNQDGSNHKMFLVSEKNNVNNFIELGIS